MGNSIMSRLKRIGTTLYPKAGESIRSFANLTGATYGHDNPITDEELGKANELSKAVPLNGFDLLDPDSLPEITFDTGTRLFRTDAQSGQASFHYWSNGIKYVNFSSDLLFIPDTTGTYYVSYDGVNLVYQDLASINTDTFYEYAIVALVYWNATNNTAMVGNEMHGIRMDSRTHHAQHSTLGALYESPGLDITGLAGGSIDYTTTTSGYFWDEDIRHTVAAQATHKFIYRLGATGEWTQSSSDNEVGYKDGADTYYSWNEWTGSTWQLSQGGSSTDYFITFFITTPSISGESIVKIIGQNGYSSRNNARDAIYTEIANLSTNGLPSPEFVFLCCNSKKRWSTSNIR